MEGLDGSAERKREIVERRLRSEINRGVQTIQYQVVTLMTTNGQAPFITVFMYLGEARNAGKATLPSSSRRPWCSAMRA
ncbi:MAG: anaerobic ribonucleoside-triphosphate reductase [Flavonifractor plautii]